SMGEPAGVGTDLIMQIYARRAELKLPPFCVFGHSGFLKSRAAKLGLDIEIASVRATDSLSVFADALPVVDIDGLVPDHPGKTSMAAAGVVIASIEQAVAATLTGACRGLVTAPIHKGALYHAGFNH